MTGMQPAPPSRSRRVYVRCWELLGLWQTIHMSRWAIKVFFWIFASVWWRLLSPVFLFSSLSSVFVRRCQVCCFPFFSNFFLRRVRLSMSSSYRFSFRLFYDECGEDEPAAGLVSRARADPTSGAQALAVVKMVDQSEA